MKEGDTKSREGEDDIPTYINFWNVYAQKSFQNTVLDQMLRTHSAENHKPT